MKRGYSPAVVAFLDVLGFADKVASSTADPQAFRRIQSLLTGTRRLAANLGRMHRGSDKYHTIRTRMFSDSIVISSQEVSDDAINRVVGMSMVFQLNAVMNGFLLRGAIVVDDHYENGNAAFGPAIISAYELEQLAGWPRVLMGPSALAALSARDLYEARDEYLLQGNDGLPYVDYLKDLFVNLSVRQGEADHGSKIDRLTLVLNHKKALVSGVEGPAAQNNIRILSKYHAAVSYHNASVRRLMAWMPQTPTIAGLKQTPGIDAVLRMMEEVASSKNAAQPEFQDSLQKVAQSLYDDRKLLESYTIDMLAYFPQFHELTTRDPI